ncbi:MAG: multiheme c-type cytochrome [Sphingopyxis sp.]
MTDAWQRARMRISLFGAAAAILLAALVLVAPEARSNAAQDGAHLGVASCAGSTCHGRMLGDGPVVRQDEIARWQEPSTQSGAHSRAYSVLSNARSRTIARNLGIADAASSSTCLGCHSSAAATSGGAFRYQLSDGVNCESCHGASSGWIASHYAGTLTGAAQHDDNVRRGLRRLEDPVVRAGVCLDCHFGSATDGQFVTHRIMAAGHPRIAFELDLFSTLQMHHVEDADYAQRKGSVDHVRMWAVGQAMAIERSLSLFQNANRGTDGVFPEFTFYDCHSCHRRIFDQAQPSITAVGNPARPIPQGMPPYNDENMIMLSAAARVAAPSLATRFDEKARAFHAAMTRDRGAAVAAARELMAAVGDVRSALAGTNFGAGSARQMAQAIAGEAIRARFTDYEGSVQAVMGIDTLLNAMISNGQATVGSAAGIRGDINRAYAAVRDPNAYRPRDFQSALASAVRSIGAL